MGEWEGEGEDATGKRIAVPIIQLRRLADTPPPTLDRGGRGGAELEEEDALCILHALQLTDELISERRRGQLPF